MIYLMKFQSELDNYQIYFTPQQNYEYLANLEMQAIAFKGNDYVEELWITEEDHIGAKNYRELQLKAKYYLVYEHNKSNLALRFKVNNAVANESFSTYQFRYTKNIIKLTIFLSLLLNYVQEKLRRKDY